jgi:protein O-GlcNAc transferase
MATISEALAVAVRYHRSGNLQQAEAIYRQILQADPNHADALQLLGVIAAQAGRFELAVQYISRAIRKRPSDPTFHNNLGNALKGQGRLAEAIANIKRPSASNPTTPKRITTWALP